MPHLLGTGNHFLANLFCYDDYESCPHSIVLDALHSVDFAGSELLTLTGSDAALAVDGIEEVV